jgi:heme oxygenase
MLLRLGIETASHQAAADEDRLAALNVASVDEYRDLLLRIFGFETSIERAVLPIQEFDSSFIEDRLRSMFLREDLRALGLSHAQLASSACAATVSIDSAAHALGWLFVIERQMLLSGLIARHLERVLGTGIANATAYLCAYGNRPGARFRDFADALSQLARRLSPKLIVAGATEAFRVQRQWYAVSAKTRISGCIPVAVPVAV